MSFMEAVKACYSKFATFSGRASRSEYWWFFLFYVIVYIGLTTIAAALGSEIFGLTAFAFVIASLIPSLAVGARRLHDIDKSGWWLLLSIIPIVCLVLIYFFALKGTDGDNQYGADPLASA